MKPNRNLLPMSYAERGLFETSGMAEINKQLRREIPPMINGVGWLAIGMIAGAAIVGLAVMILA